MQASLFFAQWHNLLSLRYLVVLVHDDRRVLDPEEHGALRRRVLHLVLELARVVGAVLRHELPPLDPLRPDEPERGDHPVREPPLQLLLLVPHLVAQDNFQG